MEQALTKFKILWFCEVDNCFATEADAMIDIVRDLNED